MKVRIGTRTSRLALWQSEWVARLLREADRSVEVEIVAVRTLGDRDRATALHGLSTQGVFTKEIESALLDGRCDLAVHSMKDLPVRLPEGLRVGAVLERADPRDALLAREDLPLASLPAGSRVGTSSLRRRSQLLHLRPDLVACDLRGNVPARLRAVGKGGGGEEPRRRLDATILAAAGLERLGLAGEITELLAPADFLPAPAQGVVAVEIRAEEGAAGDLAGALDHAATRAAAAAEREFLEALGGWCHVPVGALATPAGEGHRLDGMVGDPEGKVILRDEAYGKDPAALGRALAEKLSARGAREILARVVGDGERG